MRDGHLDAPLAVVDLRESDGVVRYRPIASPDHNREGVLLSLIICQGVYHVLGTVNFGEHLADLWLRQTPEYYHTCRAPTDASRYGSVSVGHARSSFEATHVRQKRGLQQHAVTACAASHYAICECVGTGRLAVRHGYRNVN